MTTNSDYLHFTPEDDGYIDDPSEPLMMTGNLEEDTINLIARQPDIANRLSTWISAATDGPECTDEDYLAAQRETQQEADEYRRLIEGGPRYVLENPYPTLRAQVNTTLLTPEMRDRLSRLNERFSNYLAGAPVNPILTYGPSTWFSTNIPTRWDSRLAYNTVDEGVMFRPFADKPEIDLGNRQRTLRNRRHQKALDFEVPEDRTEYERILDNCQLHSRKQAQWGARFAYEMMEVAFSCLNSEMTRHEFDLRKFALEHLDYMKEYSSFSYYWDSGATDKANLSDMKLKFHSQLNSLYHGYFALILVVRIHHQRGNTSFHLPPEIKMIFANAIEDYYACWETMNNLYPKLMWPKRELLSKYVPAY